MSDRPIAFLDSGVGGIPYLIATLAACASDRYVYFADNRNFPYGERTTEEVRELAVGAAARVIELAAPRTVVVACNTASVVALEALRDRFDVPFVGVVPAIKPAAGLVGDGRIGVLATARTVEDAYLTRLIRTYAPDNEVVLVAAGGLVELVERRLGGFSEAELLAALEPPVATLREARVATVVLGCTHFIHVRPAIERLLDDGVRVVDSVAGVVRQTLRVAGPPTPADDTGPPARVYLSDVESATESYHYLARRHGLELCDANARHRAHR